MITRNLNNIYKKSFFIFYGQFFHEDFEFNKHKV